MAEKKDMPKAPAKPDSRPVAVTVEVQAPVTEERRFYWMGSVDPCPFASPHVAGLDFPRVTEKVTAGTNSDNRSRERKQGIVRLLTKSQVDLIKAKAPYRVVRRGAGKSQIVRTDNEKKPYRPNKNDTPLAQYLYLMPVDGPDGYLGKKPVVMWSPSK